LEHGDVAEAAAVAARALAPTPFPMAISRAEGKGERSMLAGFQVIFGRFPGHVVVAKEGGRVAGVMRMVEWPRCQMTLSQQLRLAPTVLVSGPGMAWRGKQGTDAWAKQDPKETHWHLGPLAVVPELQGHGIGSQLLREFCARVDDSGLAAYLETDRPENVRLYERFGFSVTKELPVLGVRCYFMWRPALAAPR
jgi:ribosomal protein S18 acetylase RimI-like enzyme